MRVELRGKGYAYEKVKNIYPFVQDNADLLVCVGDPHIYKQEEIDSYKMGIINVHTSLLPKYRGRHPLVWAIMCGEKETGVTIHYMDEGIDTGDIITQVSVSIEIDDTYMNVLEKCTNATLYILPRELQMLERGYVNREPQRGRELSWPRRVPEDSRIDWTKTPEEIINFIRALDDPMPNAFTEIKGRKICLKISKVT